MLLLGVSLRRRRHRTSSRPRALVRVAMLGAVAASALATAGCGGGSDGSGSGSVSGLPSVAGALGEQAVITIPTNQPPPTQVESGVLVRGGGEPLADGDAVVVDYTLMNWTGAKLIGSTYGTGGTPDKTQEFVLGSDSALGSWNRALRGVQVGSRVEIVTPPSGAFGTGGATSYGIKGTDDLVYVIDVVGGYAQNADITGTQPDRRDADLPAVTGNPGSGGVHIQLPATAAPGRLETTVLIHGSGAAIATGQRLMVQYTGVDWNTGKQFDSSFGRGVASFVFGSDTVISGWNKGLAGVHVGDRVLLVVPAADAYGGKGVASAGIRGGDTLVFVVDVVDALS